MIKNGFYDSSWDEDNDELWDQKFIEWQSRDWRNWLLERLSFPFEVERKEDFDSNPFSNNKNELFSVGNILKAISLEDEYDDYGILIKVKESRKTGYVPLCDVEVTSRKNENFWPVREYVVWFANR
ncbi:MULTISPECIES: calcium-binding protein [Thiorhodovibrio]|uniref:calcium-binding protein n=1 Tax=Thiorhodovibrio TaxID=61593 RepID=UPI00191375C5|nr:MULTISPECIES: calcium-binding protein [Thiorhodovibrio]